MLTISSWVRSCMLSCEVVSTFPIPLAAYVSSLNPHERGVKKMVFLSLLWFIHHQIRNFSEVRTGSFSPAHALLALPSTAGPVGIQGNCSTPWEDSPSQLTLLQKSGALCGKKGGSKLVVMSRQIKKISFFPLR